MTIAKVKKDVISVIARSKYFFKNPISIIFNKIGYELSSSQACICKTLHAQITTFLKKNITI